MTLKNSNGSILIYTIIVLTIISSGAAYFMHDYGGVKRNIDLDKDRLIAIKEYQSFTKVIEKNCDANTVASLNLPNPPLVEGKNSFTFTSTSRKIEYPIDLEIKLDDDGEFETCSLYLKLYDDLTSQITEQLCDSAGMDFVQDSSNHLEYCKNRGSTPDLIPFASNPVQNNTVDFSCPNGDYKTIQLAGDYSSLQLATQGTCTDYAKSVVDITDNLSAGEYNISIDASRSEFNRRPEGGIKGKHKWTFCLVRDDWADSQREAHLYPISSSCVTLEGNSQDKITTPTNSPLINDLGDKIGLRLNTFYHQHFFGTWFNGNSTFASLKYLIKNQDENRNLAHAIKITHVYTSESGLASDPKDYIIKPYARYGWDKHIPDTVANKSTPTLGHPFPVPPSTWDDISPIGRTWNSEIHRALWEEGFVSDNLCDNDVTEHALKNDLLISYDLLAIKIDDVEIPITATQNYSDIFLVWNTSSFAPEPIWQCRESTNLFHPGEGEIDFIPGFHWGEPIPIWGCAIGKNYKKNDPSCTQLSCFYSVEDHDMGEMIRRVIHTGGGFGHFISSLSMAATEYSDGLIKIGTQKANVDGSLATNHLRKKFQGFKIRINNKCKKAHDGAQAWLYFKPGAWR